MKLSTCEGSFIVRFLEQHFIKFLYTDKNVYSRLGKELCFVLDFAFNLGGTEAMAESFYSVMISQLKNNQSNDTMDMRTLIDFCFPEPSACPNAINRIAEIFTKGCSKYNIAKHRSQLFYDKRGRAAGKYLVSKAVDAHRESLDTFFIN